MDPESGRLAKEMTEMDMTEGIAVVEQEVDTSVLYKQLTPFVPQTPTALLSRKYLIYQEDSWTGSAFHLSAAIELLREPNIQKALNTFRYMRADLELTVQLISAPSQFGLVCVSNVPWHQEGLNPGHTLYDRDSLWAAEPLLLPVSSQEAAMYTIPYKGQWEFLPLSSTGTWNNSVLDFWHFAEVYVATQGDQIYTISSDVPNTIGIQIWASFRNPVVEGFAEAQMDAGAMAAMAGKAIASSPAVKQGVSDAADYVVSQARCYLLGDCPVNMTATNEGEVAGVVKDASKSVSQDLYGNVSTCAPRGGRMNTLETVSNFRLPSDAYGPTPTSVLEIAKTPSLFTYGTLDAVTNVSDWFTADISRMLDPQTSISNTYLGQVARMYRFWRGSLKYAIMFFVSPLMAAKVRISLSWDAEQSVTDVGDVFSKIITVRGTCVETFTVPYFRPSPYAECFPTTAYTKNANLPSQGTLFPRVQIDLVGKVVTPGAGGNEIVPYVVYVSGGPDFELASPQAPFVVHQAPVAMNLAPRISKTKRRILTEGVAEAQMNVRELFGEEFPPFGVEGGARPGTKPYPSVDKFENLLGRFSSRYDTTPTHGGPLPFGTTITKSNFMKHDTFDYLSNMFLLWRGATIHKFELDPGATNNGYASIGGSSFTNFAGANPSVFNSNGVVINNAKWWGIAQFEAPYLSPFHVSFVAPPGSSTFPSTGTGHYPFYFARLEVEEGLISAGKDYQLFYLMPPFAKGMFDTTV